ncbi:MAG: GH3 auxin-responsive promoter family protein [Leptolyngbyaceae cyanobacterium MO_188.B28]|nr:GH3 auxin-responsive promoter family protein [Leptolyngbyaceae cyanobacterium MO_188.B28]
MCVKNGKLSPVTENTVLAALTEAIKVLGNDCQIVDYTTRMEFAQQPWRYVIYSEVSQTFETLPDLTQCQVRMEQIIYEMNKTYLELRQANSIGSLEFKLVENGAFERLKNKIISQGGSETQFKMPRLVKKSTFTDFLEMRVIGSSEG